MIVKVAQFRKFSVDVKPVLDTLPAYKPNSWGGNWEIIQVKGTNASAAYTWARENANGVIDVADTNKNSILIGFSDPTDAILFKLSYVDGVSFL